MPSDKAPADGEKKKTLRCVCGLTFILTPTRAEPCTLRPGEPITFCEESFANHRSSAMRSFLTMAVNLQLFKQGEPITFCEESFANHRSSAMRSFLTMAVNLQLFKQRGGAFFNTAVTKARSQAKKGIRDIKGRLKAREEEDEGATHCAGSPTSTKSLSPRRLQKMRR
ncbi:hypothetical protein CRUP_003900, partial [Coryphaenoides rupestris]